LLSKRVGVFMIILCEGCAAKYFLPDARVPSKPTRVRCPQCKAVFTLAPRSENVVAGVENVVVRSAAKSPDGALGVRERTAPAKPPAESGTTPERGSTPTARAGDRPGGKPSPQVTAKGPKRKKVPRNTEQDRARRLARVLVSDILCYNQDKRDQALVEGDLMTALGDEIKKSWELYKEKVGPEVAKSTDYFKEALNEILADGQKVF
jgi:predicted Zn finger-like uncharacterized protein